MPIPSHKHPNRSQYTISSLGFYGLTLFALVLVSFSVSIPSVFAQSVDPVTLDDYMASAIYPVRLELKVLNTDTKINGSTIIEDRADVPYTNIETVYTVRARAFGGDVYLPTYREDIVFSTYVTTPQEGTNALVPGVPSVELLKKLPQVENKFLLKEYEEVDLKIRISFKVIPSAMPARLVFAPRLDTVLWYPTVYANGQNDPGISSDTGERLINIPLVQATYVPQQVTQIGARAESIILIKGNKALTAAKENIQSAGGFANIRNIFRRIFSR